jgi:signal transduction histidine kinase
LAQWENSCFPLFDDEGNIIAGVEVCRVITDRAALAEEVRQRSIELGTLNDQLNHKTKELEKAYQDLKTAHSRMLQQEKMASIGQLNQVFMNLLVNAAQAIQHQGKIDIKTQRVDDTIAIEVADTGCGIPTDKLNRIFESFFTTKEVGQGTGLGLSIAYDIVEKHGGEIAVQSEPGLGTRFTLSLPIRTETEKVE